MFSLNHPCPKTCHNIDDDGGLEHRKCQEPCEQTCKSGHPCPKKCHEPCPLCVAKVVKTLPYTHSQTVMCCRDPNKECHCSTMVIKEFTICKHQIELPCDWDVANERCQQECGMILDWEYICTANKCYKRTSHDEVDCRQPYSRTLCPEKHPCPKKCFEECGPCQYYVIKTLPCSHKMEIKCCVPPKDAYCSAKITRMLDNCEHSLTMDCSASTKGYKWTELCNRPLCLNNHLCQKLCREPCGPCYVQVEKQLPCGHSTNMVCVRDPLKVRCRVPKEVILKDCGHRAEVDCGVVESDWVYCDYPCEIRLNCGHQCTIKCYMRDDPDHANYLKSCDGCEKLCGRRKVNCKRENKCNKKCYEKCERCWLKEVRLLPCGHTVLTECGIDDKNVFCEDVMKTIPGCGHLHKFSCSTNVEGKRCNQLFNRQLICGYQRKKTCSEECNEKDCMELVPIHTMSFCGHHIVKICSEVHRDPRANYVTDLIEKIQFLPNCPQSCGSLLACEHPCKGNCGYCFNGRIHKFCEEKCRQILVCGRSCKVNCASSYPHCHERCQYRCEHSRCNKKCGDPCEKCTEPCKWSCKHFKCSDPCDRPRCDDPWEKRLPCGHFCIGLCGAKCSPLCRVCDGEKLTEFIPSGEEEREDLRFVYLKDCGHSIEVECLDLCMDVKDDEGTNVEIQMKWCPRCKTLIRFNYRYGDTIKRNLSDIERVKELLLDPPSNFRSLMFHLFPNVSRLKAFNIDLKPELNDPSFTRSQDQYLTDLQKNVLHISGVDVGSFPAKNQ